MSSPRVLYLHGFASGPRSKKGVAVAEHLGRRGIHVDRLDLRLPSLERLDFDAMVARVRDAIGDESDRALVIGSSLGGYTAAYVAALDARVFGVVMLAPAFGFGPRWRERLGLDGWQRWMDDGWLDVQDHATGGTSRVHAEFARRMDTLPAQPDVRVPTLILHGVDDDVVPVEGSRAYARDRRHVRLVELEDDHDLVSSLPVILSELDTFAAPVLGR